MTDKTPVFLLKTKSLPADSYEEYFTELDGGRYTPIFVPVLEHKFTQSALDSIKQHILNGAFLPDQRSDRSQHKYGGMIFTSQRAVEAFTFVIDELRQNSVDLEALFSHSLPIYVVGPATARGLRALSLPCQILGEEAGNGEALAGFMLDHYNSIKVAAGTAHESSLPKPGLLFLVGEQRRDIIPKTLTSTSLPAEQRINVDELTVYETGVMESFFDDLSQLVSQNPSKVENHWVIVFSPTGCKAMLEVFDMLDKETGRVKVTVQATTRRPRIATIGPFTRDCLINEFVFTPDVCAAKPTAEGLGQGILAFEKTQQDLGR